MEGRSGMRKVMAMEMTARQARQAMPMEYEPVR